jgi:hypothetical protein
LEFLAVQLMGSTLQGGQLRELVRVLRGHASDAFLARIQALASDGEDSTKRRAQRTVSVLSQSTVKVERSRSRRPTKRLSRRSPRWLEWRGLRRLSQFSAPRQGRARELVGPKSPFPYQTHERHGSAQHDARPRGGNSRHGDTGFDTACHGVCSRGPSAAAPPLSPNQHARPATRLALEHRARCAGTIERHRETLRPTVMLSPRRAASDGHDLGQDGCSMRLRGVEQQDAADEVRSPRWRPSLLILVLGRHARNHCMELFVPQTAH